MQDRTALIACIFICGRLHQSLEVPMLHDVFDIDFHQFVYVIVAHLLRFHRFELHLIVEHLREVTGYSVFN